MLKLFATVLSKAPRCGLALFFNEFFEKKEQSESQKSTLLFRVILSHKQSESNLHQKTQFHDTASQCGSVRLSNLRQQVHRFQVLFVLLFPVPPVCLHKCVNEFYLTCYLHFQIGQLTLLFILEETRFYCRQVQPGLLNRREIESVFALGFFFFFSFFLL